MSEERSRGFTLIELIVVIGLIALIGGLALFVSMDAYRGGAFRSDRDLFVSLLQRARAQAVDNVCLGTCTDGKPHGVAIDSGSYVLFQGSAYASRDTSVDAIFPANPNVSRPAAFEVVFSPLSGNTPGTSVTLSQGSQSSVITISTAGQITWTN